MSHRNRDRDPRDERDYRGSRGSRDPGRESLRDPPQPGPSSRSGGSSRSALNEYWIDGDRIHREVLQKQICKMLGPEAYSRPSVYNGISGYCVTAVRPFTPSQLDDLIRVSKEYVMENREIQRNGYQAISYGESQTSRLHDGGMRSGPVDPYIEEYRPPRSQPAYPASASQRGAAPFYPESIYPPGPGFPQGSDFPPVSGYPSQGFPAASRPRTIDSDNYIYAARDDFQESVDPYRQTNAYAQVNREPARVEREPRYMERDPRDYERDSRDVRDSRIDPRDRRVESRAVAPGYPSYIGPSGDMRMIDADDDRYRIPDNAPAIQDIRGFQSAPRAVPGGYNPRGSPGLREYRPEPMREERRRR